MHKRNETEWHTKNLQRSHDFDMPYLTGETCTFILDDTLINYYYLSTRTWFNESPALARQGDSIETHIGGFF